MEPIDNLIAQLENVADSLLEAIRANNSSIARDKTREVYKDVVKIIAMLVTSDLETLGHEAINIHGYDVAKNRESLANLSNGERNQ